MAFNQFMHPRNVYRSPPDFKELATKYSEFRKYAMQDLSGKVHIDFKNPDALRALTLTLLKKDFDLEIEIPKDRLIPTLPLRLNYILWIEDLLSVFPDRNGDVKADVLGLDVGSIAGPGTRKRDFPSMFCSRVRAWVLLLQQGTGSTCIYPLLGSRKNRWKFVATDSDVEAVEYAKRNIAKNGLDDAIKAFLVPEDASLVEAVRASGRRFDFSMCNPPFFVNETEAKSSGKGRKPSIRPPPRAMNCHRQHEAVTEGGEVAFVRRMIDDSLSLKDSVRLYSTMLGKKQSLGAVKTILNGLDDKGVQSIATTEFCQGHTMRWGIAWTFIPHADLEQVRPVKKKKVKEKPVKPLGFLISKQAQEVETSLANIIEKTEEILLELKMSFTELKQSERFAALRCVARENTWSHQRRKRRASLRRQAALIKEHDSITALAVESTSTEDARQNCHDLEQPVKKMRADTPEEVEPLTADAAQPTRLESAWTTVPGSSQGPAYETIPALECLLTLRTVGLGTAFEIQWTRGSLGKDSTQQVMQYFKNKLSSSDIRSNFAD